MPNRSAGQDMFSPTAASAVMSAQRAATAAAMPKQDPRSSGWGKTINDIYRATINRDADAQEIETWSQRMLAGYVTGDSIAQTLRSSPEWRQAHIGPGDSLGPITAQPGGTATHQPASAGAERPFWLPGSADTSTGWDSFIAQQYFNLTGKQIDDATLSQWRQQRGAMDQDALYRAMRTQYQPGSMPAAPGTQQHPVALPWQIHPAVWDSLGNVGRQLALGYAEQAGWDAGDYERQIKAARPVGVAPRRTETQYAAPRGVYR